MKEFYVDMCKENSYYTDKHCTANELLDKEPECCKDDFVEFRIMVLAIA